MEAINDLKAIFIKDLSKLSDEIKAYDNEKLIWEIIPGTSNSGGNLTMHLIGNLRHFIGSVIGESGYIRNREAEFSDRNIPVSQIQNQIIECKSELESAFSKLEQQSLADPYPIPLGNFQGSKLQILLHLSGHLSYHLGQINYHRRYVSATG